MVNTIQFLKKIISANALFFILLLVFLGGTAFADALKPFDVGVSAPFAIDFTISPGMSVQEIAQALSDERIIRSKDVFRMYSILSGRATSFQPGVYTISSALSAREIVHLLTRGPIEVEVRIIPGMTMLEVEDILVANNVVREGAIVDFSVDALRDTYPFLDSAITLEGFLFPDTYRFHPHSDPNIVVSKFLDNFAVKTGILLAPLSCTGSWQAGALSPSAECQDSLQGLHNTKNNDTIHWLIIASILEKEVTNEHEANIVAGILEKRLAIGMPLQVDASIIYAKCNRFISCPSLTRADFRIESPYNTYLYKGLPPAPISNPGIEAISAARSPVRSNFLYYLSDPRTRKTIFSETFDEHNANRIKYLY